MLTFNDLKLGMQFKLYSQDNATFVICKIMTIDNTFHNSEIKRNYILVDFDDINQTTVYGKLNDPIHKFMEYLK